METITTRRCAQCANQLSANASFCSKCGTRYAGPRKTRRRVLWTLLGAGVLAASLGSCLDSPSSNNSTASAPAASATVAVAAQTDNAGSAYFGQVHEEAGALGASLGRMADLCRSPLPQDRNWQAEVALELAMWKATYTDAQKLQPPAGWSEWNDRWLAQLASLDTAADEFASGIDHSDTGLLEESAARVRQVGPNVVALAEEATARASQ